VTDPSAATLTLGTDYTATLDGNAVQNFPVKISTAGNYTLVLTGAGSYTGTKTFNITATGDPVNSALAIGSEAEWDTFAESVNNGNNYSNQFVKLTADISVSTMVGTSETNSFQGTFLGDGTHTLTFTQGTSESAFNEQNCAPFRYVNGATIRDLKVAGYIYTSQKFAAGLVSRPYGTTNITNCQVGTVIHSSVSGDGTHGGIVAMPASNTNIEGCVFNGRLLTTSGTQYCGGFVGWSGNTTAIVTNSLYAPDANIAVAQGETAINFGATFVRGNNPTITGCCYTETMGNAQGTQVYSITPDTGITIENAGEVSNEYNVSGLTFYTTGFKCGDVHYAASGDEVNLNLSCVATSSMEYYVSAGTLTGNANPYTLTMPAENVVIGFNIIREIAGYDDGNDKWAFIASPVNSNIAPTAVTNLVGSVIPETNPVVYDYDLYRLNPSTVMWENYNNQEHQAGFNLVNGQGYLYATKETKTLVFSGTFNTESSKIVGLSDGFNLVGNPFVVDAYVSKPFYQMNAEGTEIVPIDNYDTYSPVTIPPCYGVVVRATGTDFVTFSTEAPAQQGANNNGNLQMTLTRADVRSDAFQDKAIVSFNESSQLEKFVFNERNAKLYIPQDGNDYAIAFSEMTGEVPLNFRATETGRYTIGFNFENVKGVRIQLIDKLEGSIIELNSNDSYTFMGSTADRSDRFTLVFTQVETGSIFAYQSGNDIIVSGEGELQVFDMMGRMVMNQHINGVQTFEKPSQTGVYIFKLNAMTQKIVVR
jgi:hypothetical protein